MARLFISQERLDRLTAEARVVLVGDALELPALGARFRLQPAVHFLTLVAGEDQALLGRVKTAAQLLELGAELVADSVLCGESAYQCESGFVGTVDPFVVDAPRTPAGEPHPA